MNLINKIILKLEAVKKLQDKLSRSAYKKAIRQGCKLIIADIKATAPERSGALRQSISSKVDSAKGSTVAYGIVGPRSKFVKAYKGRNVKPSRYAAVLEKKKPFLLPSFNANKAAYLARVSEVVAEELNGQ